MFSKRILSILTAAVVSTSAVACADNAEDHAEEAAEEARSGDVEEAGEEMEETREDLQQGDTTELLN